VKSFFVFDCNNTATFYIFGKWTMVFLKHLSDKVVTLQPEKRKSQKNQKRLKIKK